MKTKAFFELLVADMTELEMTDLLEACNEAIQRNNWKELRAQAFESDRVDDLEEKVSDLEYDLEEFNDRKKETERQANRALKFLTEGKIDEAKQTLSEI